MIIIVVACIAISWVLVVIAILGYVYANTLPGSVGFVMHAIVIAEGLVCAWLEDRNRSKMGAVTKKVLSAIWFLVLVNFVISAVMQYGVLDEGWNGRTIAGLWVGITATCAMIFTNIFRRRG